MTHIEIVSIGNEVLSGQIVNTNAAFLSQSLEQEGYEVFRHTTLSDDEKEMKEGLKEALLRSSIVMATGGLGPTLDDCTKKVAFDLFEIPQNSSKVKVLKNEMGSAPGFIFAERSVLILLPGVPYEMKWMYETYVKDFLRKKFPIKKKIFREKLFLCLLPEDKINPFLQEMKEEHEEIKIGIYPFYDKVEVHFVGENEKNLQKCKKVIEEEFSSYVYSDKDPSLSKAVHEAFLEKRKTLILGESCTGGSLASSLTQHPGSSKYFLGSAVVYSNEMKEKMLNVSKKTLLEKGAVSIETVSEMIDGLFNISKADYAVAISGIAGPTGGSLEKPIGTVCFAFGKRGEKIDAGVIHFLPQRSLVISRAVGLALGILWRKLVHNRNFFDA